MSERVIFKKVAKSNLPWMLLWWNIVPSRIDNVFEVTPKLE